MRISPMAIAIGVSVLLHLGLLTIRFVEPEAYNRILEDTPLEVILVNARSEEAPENPQAIAQHNLNGGGNLDQPGIRATSPLPPSPFNSYGNELGATPGSSDHDDDYSGYNGQSGETPSQQQIDDMQRQQMELLTQVKKQLADLPAAIAQAPASSQQQQQLQEKRQLMLNILGEIERRIQTESSRPRRNFIGASTIKGVQALYYESLKQKIEEKGTSNFPEHNGQKLYGKLVMAMVVNHDGRVLETRIWVPSGNQMLDRRAEAIAISAGPFGAFDSELRKFTDQLEIVSTFKFTRNNTLETQNFDHTQSLKKP